MFFYISWKVWGEDASKGCDHSHKHTLQWLKDNTTLNEEQVKSFIGFLMENGGYCDCEVYMNVGDKVDTFFQTEYASKEDG